MKNKTLLTISFAFIAFSSQISQATIIGGGTTGTGSFFDLSLSPPASVGNDNFQNPNLYGFNEDQNVAVGAGGLTANQGLLLLAQGTIVASHYIFFDPSGLTTQVGHVLFDADILSIFTSQTTLDASDYLANTGVTYLSTNLRGLESGDSATINGTNAKQLDVNWRAGTPGDYIRVLTKKSPGAVPDNGTTALLLSLGLGALALVRRRKS